MLSYFASRHLALMPTCVVALTFVMSGLTSANDTPLAIDENQPAYRMPIALAWQHDRLFSANARTGSVSRIDTRVGHVSAEWKVAESLSDIAPWKNGLLVLDDQQDRILHVIPNAETDELNLAAVTDVGGHPVKIAINWDQTLVAVSSLWSHQLTIMKENDNRLTVWKQLDLPFAPRELLFVKNECLIVADAFGSGLAIVDCLTGEIVYQHAVHGHNIRGLTLDRSGTQLYVTCQTLDPGVFTSYEHIFWGVAMQNGLHALPLGTLLSRTKNISASVVAEPKYDGSSRTTPDSYPLGTPSIGSGDPGEIVLTHNDTTLLLLSGVNQVAFRTSSRLPFERLKTGRRPGAICLRPDQRQAFVANRFDDSITVISLSGESPVIESTISLGQVRELTLAEQGEQVFYDATVSLDGWFSCHSCHTDGHTSGLRADTFGDDDIGAPKQIISLLGTKDTGPWAWNGSKTSLEEQIETSLIISMQTQLTNEELPIKSLAAFLRSLQPAPSKSVAREKLPSREQVALARLEFDSAGCHICHSGDAMTSHGRYDVNIHDDMGDTEFNPPSLRGVSQRSPYFHDGRAATLSEVLKSSHHDPRNPLTDEQIRRLLILLESL